MGENELPLEPFGPLVPLALLALPHFFTVQNSAKNDQKTTKKLQNLAFCASSVVLVQNASAKSGLLVLENSSPLNCHSPNRRVQAAVLRTNRRAPTRWKILCVKNAQPEIPQFESRELIAKS